ncbi:pilus assembly protein PilM [Bdellovibrio svalbardensis]|uniref:Pilus assembly protein PilM n=1 Tax=Bdellovibrio svalbardensis TaxID=2972972 RepID=A0ABT6DMX3_9BACT|nr:pilus assembly protein PilM [Bdellovibrio svalbardensis]MDG0817445.1 pilus assembly protein PilM [Bdellovibrio svalbardensis]
MSKSLGIDIGSSSIKVVEMQSTSKGFQVSHFFEHPLSNKLGSDQELEVIEYLRDLTSKYDDSTRFIVGLRQDRVAIRNKFFPFNDRIKIFKSLAFELEEDLPFSSDNAIFDAKIIRTVGGGAEVLACAAPKTHVQACIQRAQDSGFEPFLVSLEGTALANVFEKWNEAPPALVAPAPVFEDMERPVRHVQLILNMGHTRTIVSAFEGHSLIGVRSILWGGKNIAEAIAKKYEIPYVEALKELQTKAFILTNKQGATFDQVTFSETIGKSVRELARDLQLSILEFKGEFNVQIDSIGLTGGTSQIQNLGPFLTQILEAPVNRIPTLDQIPNVMFERTQQVSAKAGVALGLAIEGFKKPRNPPMNFMRGEFARENHQMKMFWEKWGHTFKVATAALVVLFVYASLRSDFALSLTERTQDVLKSQAKSVANLKGKNASEAGIKKYIRENKKRASDLKTLASVANMNSAMDVLKKVSDATPPKGAVTLDVHSLNVQDSRVTMEGYVSSPQEMSLLQKSLTNITTDGQVKTERSSLGTLPGRTSFSFSFNVDRGIQKVTR